MQEITNIKLQALSNGVEGLKILSAKDVTKLEPLINTSKQKEVKIILNINIFKI